MKMKFNAVIFALITLLLPPVIMGVKTGKSFLKFKSCSKEITKFGDQKFTWAHSNGSDYVISEPLCLNKSGMIVSRKCLNGELIPKEFSKCDYVPKNYICPEDLLEVPIDSTSKPLCVEVSKQPVEWSEHLCLGSNITMLDMHVNEVEKILKYLGNANVETFWMPAQNINNSYTNNCAIGVVNKKRVYNTSNCNDRHHAVCIFKPPIDLANSSGSDGCPKWYGAMIYQPNICYGIGGGKGDTSDTKRLSVPEYFAHRNAIHRIFSKIKLSEDTYFLLGTALAGYNLVMNIKEEIKLHSYFGAGRYLAVMILKPPGEPKPHPIENLTNESSKIIMAPNEHTFATFLDIACDLGTCQKIRGNKNLLKKQAENTMKTLMNAHWKKSKPLQIHSLKVMMINNESFDEDLRKIIVLCHVSASLILSAETNSDDMSTHEYDEYDEENHGIPRDMADFMMTRFYLNQLLKLNNSNSLSVNSTEFCFPEPFSNNSKNYWLTAIPGETSETSELIVQLNDVPIVRRCVGDLLYGAMWEPYEIKQSFLPKNITLNLEQIDRSKRPRDDPEGTMKEINEIIQKNLNNLTPADVFYLGKISRTIANKVISMETSPNKQNITKTMIRDIVKLYNNIMQVNETVIKLSSTYTLNSTNVLLDEFDKLVNEVSTISQLTSTSTNSSKNVYDEDDIIERYDYRHGVAAWIASKMVVLVIDPKVSNVTGLAFYKSKTDVRGSSPAENSNYRYLYSNQLPQQLLEEDDLELATFVPEKLLNRLTDIIRSKNINSEDIPQLRIVITIYTHDILFQEASNISNIKVYKNIVSLSIPKYEGKLPELLPLVMRKTSYNSESESICRFWNFKTWSKEGIELMQTPKHNKNLVLCGSSHLTAFASIVGRTDILEFHRKILDNITLIGCSLSWIGVMGIFITALRFRTWRQEHRTKGLLHLSSAIAIQMILFCIVNTEEFFDFKTQIWTCIALGASLQYSVLVQFSWTLIIGLNQLQNIKLPNPYRSDWFFVKCLLISWVVPLIPELLIILLDPHSYIPLKSSGSEICYPLGKSLYFGVLLPVGIVLFCNLFIYINIMYTLCSRHSCITHNDKKTLYPEIKTSILLFFLLGLTWIFGLLSAVEEGIFFSYLFCITGPIQGFVLFVNCILLEQKNIEMLKGFFKFNYTGAKYEKYFKSNR